MYFDGALAQYEAAHASGKNTWQIISHMAWLPPS